METHSVPQHIQSYEFRLVGDMTLKQFTWLALGLIISFIIYNLPVYGFIKWPFILTFALLGVAMAFVPYEERPLATWIVAFFKAIYSPTQYVWKKESHPPQILVEPLNLRPLPATEVTGQLTNQQKLQEYLKTIPSQQATGAIITQEAEVQKIDQLFQSVSLPQNFVPDVSPLPEPVEEPSVVPHPLHPREEPLPPEPIPEIPLAPFESSHYQAQATKDATFSTKIPIPVTPTVSNIVVGMVLTSDNRIVENAILEIRELSSGHPVRAMRTNKIGQFSITTPLKNSAYEIITEKEPLDFEPIRFTALGDIIPPIEIHANPLLN